MPKQKKIEKETNKIVEEIEKTPVVDMTKKQKKTIKEEIREFIDKWEDENRWSGDEDINGKLHPAYLDWNEVEKELIALFRQTLQRFIEETKIPEIKLVMDESCPFCGKKKWECEGSNCRRGTYNEALKREHQKQAKWLKENL